MWKKACSLVTLLVSVVGCAAAEPADVAVLAPKKVVVYVVPVHGEINTPTLYILRRGLKEAIEQKADAVLLDMNFAMGQNSGRDGLNALARIRGLDPALSVVLMTAYGNVTLAVEALKAGAVDFVLKPWRNDELVAAACSAAGRTRSARADRTLDLDALERRAIEQALKQHQGNISAAAESLGLSRPALYRRMSKHEIPQ